MQQPLTSDISIMIILYEKTENMLLIFLGFAMLKEKLVTTYDVAISGGTQNITIK